MNLFKFLAREIFMILGGLMIGLSFPVGAAIISEENRMIDFVIFFPTGVILLGISWYYKFIDRK